GETVEGPGWVRETHGFASVPLLVRPGAVIAVGAREDRPDYDFRDGVTLRVFEPRDGVRTVTVPGPAPTTFTVSVSGETLRAERDGDALPWRLRVGTAPAIEAATGDTGLVWEA